jgi:hypothetical protein
VFGRRVAFIRFFLAVEESCMVLDSAVSKLGRYYVMIMTRINQHTSALVAALAGELEATSGFPPKKLRISDDMLTSNERSEWMDWWKRAEQFHRATNRATRQGRDGDD